MNDSTIYRSFRIRQNETNKYFKNIVQKGNHSIAVLDGYDVRKTLSAEPSLIIADRIIQILRMDRTTCNEKPK